MGLTTSLTFLRIEIDNIAQQLHLSADKLVHLNCTLVRNFKSYHTSTSRAHRSAQSSHIRGASRAYLNSGTHTQLEKTCAPERENPSHSAGQGRQCLVVTVLEWDGAPPTASSTQSTKSWSLMCQVPGAVGSSPAPTPNSSNSSGPNHSTGPTLRLRNSCLL